MLSPLPCGTFLFLQVLLAAACLLPLSPSGVSHAPLYAVGRAELLSGMGLVLAEAVFFVEDVGLIVAVAVV